jgi:hypothetical protein
MGDVWFRGESVNVAPAKAGTVSNDIGDGMYLTDKEHIAQQYAFERSTTVDQRRVYRVSIDTSGMRILDLTTDTRWKKHISTSIGGQTIEGQLQAGTASQYSKHFENFLRANKIDLNQYDAVIGSEYRNGGKQMCILYKSSQPSAVQVKIRSLFVPVGGVPVTRSPSGSLRFSGKIGPGIKYAGGTFLVGGVAFIIGYLAGKIIEKQQEAEVKRQLDNLGPKIERNIRYKFLHVLKLIASKRKAFGVVRISLDTIHMHMGPGIGYAPAAPSVSFDSVEISETERNGPDGVSRDHMLTPGSMEERHFYNFSIPITVSEEELKLYLAYRDEIRWYQVQLIYNVLPPSPDAPARDHKRLKQEHDELVLQLYLALGIPWYARVEYPHMW